jgi:hypothetical protein
MCLAKLTLVGGFVADQTSKLSAFDLEEGLVAAGDVFGRNRRAHVRRSTKIACPRVSPAFRSAGWPSFVLSPIGSSLRGGRTVPRAGKTCRHARGSR